MSDKDEWLERTALLYGQKRLEHFRKSRVLIAGLGGVGAYAAEMLCRTGIGSLVIADADPISPSNINRQLPALHSTIGQQKTAVLAERFHDINPSLHLDIINTYLSDDNILPLLQQFQPDFVVDAIDTVRCKCTLIETCLRLNIPIVSAMGAGAKTDISRIRIDDLWKTSQCGLAKAVRSYLRRDGFARKKLPVVFSDEPVRHQAIILVDGERNKKSTAGTVAYMTATFGNYLAWYVLEHLQ